MKTLSTVLRTYHFNTDEPGQDAAYKALRAKMKAAGVRPFVSWSGDGGHTLPDALDGGAVQLETAHLFADQWNTAPIPGDSSALGRRLFDWAEDARPDRGQPIGSMAPRNIRRGHYLEQTPEMAAVRRDTLKCGYCGHYERRDAGHVFCPACPGSEYLEPDNLKLTRLRPVAESNSGKFPELTETERAERMAVYQEAQREGAKTRAGAKLEAFRARVVAKAEKERRNVETERDGLLWLLDHDLGSLAAENVIFYSHTGRFGFGWWAPLDYAFACEIMGQLSDAGFPYPYDVETRERGRLNGCVTDETAGA